MLTSFVHKFVVIAARSIDRHAFGLSAMSTLILKEYRKSGPVIATLPMSLVGGSSGVLPMTIPSSDRDTHTTVKTTTDAGQGRGFHGALQTVELDALRRHLAEVEALGWPIVVIDRQGSVIWAINLDNEIQPRGTLHRPPACRLFRSQRRAVLARWWQRLTPPSDRSELHCQWVCEPGRPRMLLVHSLESPSLLAIGLWSEAAADRIMVLLVSSAWRRLLSVSGPKKGSLFANIQPSAATRLRGGARYETQQNVRPGGFGRRASGTIP